MRLTRGTGVGLLAVVSWGMVACGDDADPVTTAVETTAAPSSTASASSGSDAPSAGSTAATGSGDAATVVVEGTTGPVEVSVTTEGIFALDEYVALELLAVGVVPTHVATFMGDTTALPILEAAGVETVEPSNVEVVASAKPALIVGFGHPSHDELRSGLEAIAPVVIPVFTEPWEQQMRVIGAVTGRDAEAEGVIAKVSSRIESLGERVAASDHAGAEVSLVVQFGDGAIYAYDQTTLAGTIVAALGFERPEMQVNDDDADFGYVPISEEFLADQTAPIVVAMVDPYDPTSVLDNPLLDVSGSLSGEVLNTPWSVNTPLSAWWVLNDLEAIVFGDRQIATIEDAPRLWAELIG